MGDCSVCVMIKLEKNTRTFSVHKISKRLYAILDPLRSRLVVDTEAFDLAGPRSKSQVPNVHILRNAHTQLAMIEAYLSQRHCGSKATVYRGGHRRGESPRYTGGFIPLLLI